MNSTATPSSQQKEEPDLLNFERQLRELLHELHLKRVIKKTNAPRHI